MAIDKDKLYKSYEQQDLVDQDNELRFILSGQDPSYLSCNLEKLTQNRRELLPQNLIIFRTICGKANNMCPRLWLNGVTSEMLQLHIEKIRGIIQFVNSLQKKNSDDNLKYTVALGLSIEHWLMVPLLPLVFAK